MSFSRCSSVHCFRGEREALLDRADGRNTGPVYVTSKVAFEVYPLWHVVVTLRLRAQSSGRLLVTTASMALWGPQSSGPSGLDTVPVRMVPYASWEPSEGKQLSNHALRPHVDAGDEEQRAHQCS
jgi:hypothetical protein